jgi:hypothetical protein
MRSIVLAALILCAIEPACAQAQVTQECPDLDDAQVRARLHRLASDIDREEPAMRRWWSTFLVLHLTMASAAGILAFSADSTTFRDTMLVSSVSSSLGALTLFTFLPALVGAGGSLAGMPEDTPEDRIAKLRIAEAVMRRSAAQTGFLRDWFAVTASAVYITGGSMALLALGLVGGAYLHGIGGAVLGLGRLLLHPTGGRDAWQTYARRYPDVDCLVHASAPEDAFRWALVPQGLGLGLVMNF